MIKKLTIAMGVLAFLLIPWEVRAADWVLYAVSLDGTMEEYYDRESVASSAAGVQVTTKAVKYACEEVREKRKTEGGSENARDSLFVCAYTITQHRIDCRNRVDTLMSSVDHDRDGRVIHQSREPYVMARPPLRRSPQEIYPESFSENLIKMFCPSVP